ncbi:MAG TPA: hypothetical protein VLE89_07835 [Chlamydiales bacterium]|nr:hypothetical protein [Chlamydiales bacterium]
MASATGLVACDVNRDNLDRWEYNKKKYKVKLDIVTGNHHFIAKYLNTLNIKVAAYEEGHQQADLLQCQQYIIAAVEEHIATWTAFMGTVPHSYQEKDKEMLNRISLETVNFRSQLDLLARRVQKVQQQVGTYATLGSEAVPPSALAVDPKAEDV